MTVSRTAPGSVQLLARVLETETLPRALIVAPPEPGLPHAVGEACPDAQYVHLDYAIYRRDRDLLAASPEAGEAVFVDSFESVREAPSAVIFLPKEKALAGMLFSGIASRLEPGARVLVAGENRAGIRSVRPLIESTVGPVRDHRSGRHAVVWDAVRGDSPASSDPRLEYDAVIGEETIRVVSYPGVFSHGEFDPGTRLLLETLGRPVFQRALDWGCGSGVIGAYLHRCSPGAPVDLVDSHALALRSARETLDANGLASERVYASDGLSDVQGSFDLVVTNPPFHAGQRTHLGVTERVIRECGRFLLPGGRLVLVANAFLRYPAPLRESFREVRILAETTKYRVFEATNG